MKCVVTRGVCGLLSVLFLSVVCRAAELPRSTPEAQGVDSAGILAFVEAADQKADSLNSVMVLRHGHVIAEGWWTPYRADANHMLYSLSKSFTSTAVGLAVSEGKLSLDDSVLKFFPDDAPKDPSGPLKEMRVRDLLRMSTGHQTEPPWNDEQPWAKSFLHHPVPFKPGAHFQYNTPATYMQSAIVQKATGQTVLDYLRPRLFDPLGIPKPEWGTSPQGISIGGYGLSVRTEDIARFGQLYLQKGKWDGKQLIPESWVHEATKLQTGNGSNPQSDWDQGYGYQFWRSRHGAFRGDGAFGQYCIVMPEQDAVVAITSGTKDMQQVLNLVWDHLLPAMKGTDLSSNAETHRKLTARLQSLTIPLQTGSNEAGPALGKTYYFAANDHKIESISIQSDANSKKSTISLSVAGTEHRIDCGHGAWVSGKTNWGFWNDRWWGPKGELGVGSSAGWSGDAFHAKLCFYETPFVVSLRCEFAGDRVSLQLKPNLAFDSKSEVRLQGATDRALLEAQAAATPGTSPTSSPTVTGGHDFAKWQKAMDQFAAADEKNPPPKGASLFIGSSTIVLWKTLSEDFPNHKVINRGFGGSEIVDSTYYADRIIFPYEPKQIFLRAGGNDIHAGRTPKQVAADFSDFVAKVHGRLPKTDIYYIAVSPAPSRWGETDKYRELNRLIREAALNMPRVSYIDAFDITLDEQGQARKELFVADMLHLNPEGYKLLTAKVRPFLPTTK